MSVRAESRTWELCIGTQILMIFMIKKDVVFFGTPVCTGAGCRSFMKGMITFGVYDKIGFDFSNELHWCYPSFGLLRQFRTGSEEESLNSNDRRPERSEIQIITFAHQHICTLFNGTLILMIFMIKKDAVFGETQIFYERYDHLR